MRHFFVFIAVGLVSLSIYFVFDLFHFWYLGFWAIIFSWLLNWIISCWKSYSVNFDEVERLKSKIEYILETRFEDDLVSTLYRGDYNRIDEDDETTLAEKKKKFKKLINRMEKRDI